MKRLSFLFSIFFVLTQVSWAQEIQFKVLESVPGLKKTIELRVEPNSLYTPILTKFSFTSLSIEFPEGSFPPNAYILLGNEKKIILTKDTHTTDIGNNSSLAIAEVPQNFLSLFTGKYAGRVIIKLLYAKPIKQPSSKKKENLEACTRPETVDQSIWRDGLPPPAKTPTKTQVKHIVLHHSAGSNTNTDYINIVRNIYLFHTQNNGWDDIGYNFIVAPNGLVFDGREGYAEGEDNIKGAHFCGKNSETMGICLLGNYEDTTVSDSALQALKSLLLWKLNKENLNTYDHYMHPEGSPDAIDLAAVAGHRDGCSTACPGAFFYERIEALKTNTQEELDSCAIYTSIHLLNHQLKVDIGKDHLISITNTLPELDYSIMVFSLDGKEIINKRNINENFSFILSEKGIYLIRIYNEKGSIMYKIAL